MIYLRSEEGCEPYYKTTHSAGADLKSREDLVVKAGQVQMVPTGVWIDRVDWSRVPEGCIPELQVRARSGLAAKHGLTLANAVGTIDADFPDEIQVLIWNFSTTDYQIRKGERIAQLLMGFVLRIPNVFIGGKRMGGFGSTGKTDESGTPYVEGISTLQ